MLRFQRCLLAVGLATAACSGLSPDIHPEFEAARARAQADPGAAPADFRPDAEAIFSRDTTEAVVRAGIARSQALSTGWNGRIAGQKVEVAPDLRADTVTVSPATCAGCVDVKLELSGPVHVTAGGQERVVPVKGSGTVVLQAAAAPDATGFALTARLKSLTHLSLEVSGPAALLRDTIETAVQRAVNQGFDAARPMDVGHVGGGDVLRAVRIGAVGPSLEIAMSTRAVGSHALAAPPASPQRGVRLAVASDSLVALAAARAYGQAPDRKSHDTVAVPTSLSVKQQRFDLGLRLWSLAGRGWWRDYTAHGALAVARKGVSLTASGADEVAASPGADLADPTAALGQSAILDAIEQELTRLLPVAPVDSPVGAIALRAVTGSGDALEVDADVATP